MLRIRDCCQKLFSRSTEKQTDDISNFESTKTSKNDTTTTNPLKSELICSVDATIETLKHGNFLNEQNENFPTLKSIYDNSKFIKIYDRFFEVFNAHKKQENLFKELTFENVENAEQYAASLPKSDGNLINILIQIYRTKFSAEFCIFSSLNPMLTLISSLDKTEIIHLESYKDTIYLIEKTKSKQILTITPRVTLTIRVIRRFDQNRFIDLTASIVEKDLQEDLSVVDIINSVSPNELAVVFIAGSYYENKGDFCECISLTKMDFLSSITLRFAGYFLNRKFSELVKNTSQNLDKNNQRRFSDCMDTFLWFRDRDNQKNVNPAFFSDPQKIFAKSSC